MIRRYCNTCNHEIKDGERWNELVWHGATGCEDRMDLCKNCWDELLHSSWKKKPIFKKIQEGLND